MECGVADRESGTRLALHPSGMRSDDTGPVRREGAAGAGVQSVRERLGQVQDALTLLAGIFAYAPFAVQVYERGGRSILTNAAFRELFGAEPPPEYNVLDDEIAERAGVLGLIHRAFAGEVVHVPPMWYDPRDLRQVRVEQGRRACIEATFFPLHDPDGAVSHVAIVFKDLTAERLLQEETERERDLLQRLIGILGHDLRTPVAAVVASAALLLRRGQLPDGAHAGLVRIQRTATRMDRMISDIIDLTRGRVGGAIPIAATDADLSEIARSVIEEIEAVHPELRVALLTHGDTRGRWDPGRLAQVLANLLSNAATFGRHGAPVSVRLEGRADGVVAEIHNEGDPIPADELASIFEPFRRGGLTARSVTTPGLGLGLHVAHEIVLAHGGTISVASSAEAGTTFVVALPRAPSATQAGVSPR